MSTEITDALRRGDTEKALAAARRLVKAEPDNAEAQYLLGLALQRAGDGNGGLAAFQQAVVLAPDRPAYAFAVASLAMAMGNLDSAEKYARLASGLDPNFLPAYALAGQAALMRRDRGEAENQLKLAQRVNPNHPLSLLLEGHLARFDGDEERAMRLFMAVVKADGSLSAAHLALGLGFLRSGQLAFAQQALGNARALAPTNLTVNQALLEALRRQGKLDEALALVDELLTATRGDPALVRLRAELLIGLGRAGDAYETLAPLLVKQPDHPQILPMALETLRLDGRAHEGLPLMEAALAKSPREDSLWMLRGALAGSIGENPRTVLDRWVQTVPDSPGAWEQMAGYLEATGQPAAAAEAAQRALALKPDLPGAGLVLVRIRYLTDPEAALQALESVRVPAGQPHSLRNVMGWRALLLDRLGRHDEAAATIRELADHPLPEERPLPPLAPAEAQARAGAGTVLVALPGLRVDPLAASLRESLAERLKSGPEALAEAGDDRGVAWVSHADARLLRGLQGVRWLVLLTDPRDALLNWMVFGSAQGFGLGGDTRAAAQWLHDSLQALLALSNQERERVYWLRRDGDLAEAAVEAGRVLGVELDAAVLEAPSASSGVRPFPAGHWRHYRQAFAEEFAVLAPVAQALGYPAE